jgi:hypothetical protein
LAALLVQLLTGLQQAVQLVLLLLGLGVALVVCLGVAQASTLVVQVLLLTVPQALTSVEVGAWVDWLAGLVACIFMMQRQQVLVLTQEM